MLWGCTWCWHSRTHGGLVTQHGIEVKKLETLPESQFIPTYISRDLWRSLFWFLTYEKYLYARPDLLAHLSIQTAGFITSFFHVLRLRPIPVGMNVVSKGSRHMNRTTKLHVEMANVAQENPERTMLSIERSWPYWLQFNVGVLDSLHPVLSPLTFWCQVAVRSDTCSRRCQTLS